MMFEKPGATKPRAGSGLSYLPQIIAVRISVTASKRFERLTNLLILLNMVLAFSRGFVFAAVLRR